MSRWGQSLRRYAEWDGSPRRGSFGSSCRPECSARGARWKVGLGIKVRQVEEKVVDSTPAWAKETSRVQAGQVWKDNALRCSVTETGWWSLEDGAAGLGVRTIQAVTARTRGHDFAFPLLGVRWGPASSFPPFFPQRELPGVTLRFPHPFPRGRCVLTDWGTG